MSLRLRVISTCFDDEALDVEKEILTGAVVPCGIEVAGGNRVEPDAQGVRFFRRDDTLRRQHHEVCPMDREKRADKELFRVLEIFVEHVGHVLRSKPHVRSIANGIECLPHETRR
jgi:hypothetical protein